MEREVVRDGPVEVAVVADVGWVVLEAAVAPAVSGTPAALIARAKAARNSVRICSRKGQISERDLPLFYTDNLQNYWDMLDVLKFPSCLSPPVCIYYGGKHEDLKVRSSPGRAARSTQRF